MVNINILFRISIVYLIFVGAHAWFTMNQPFAFSLGISVVIFIISLLYKKTNKIRLTLSTSDVFAVIAFFIASLFASQITRLESFITFVLRYFPILLLICDTSSAKNTLTFVSKFLAILFIPSIVLHLIFVVTSFPPSVLFTVEGNSLYLFYNYGILLKNIAFEYEAVRFNSVFLEPGFLGTLCALLLYANRFQFKNKWWMYPIMIALLLSLSLAGYVTTLLGYIFYRYSQGLSIKKYVGYFLVGSLAFFISSNYNDGENILNKYIFSRLEQDKEKGISGNNRNSELTDFYFEKVIENGDVYLGLGRDKITKVNGGGADDGDYTNQIRGAGYKIFILYNGLFAAFFYLLFYYCVARTRGNLKMKYCIGFFLLILITFMQASYPDSYSWLVPYILGVIVLKNKKNENRNTDISCCS